MAPTDAAARRTMTGVRSQRPRPVRDRRMETYIQPTRASITGGHPHVSVERVASRGEKTRRPTPVAVIATAGTVVHRCGWLVIRAERTRITAQPSPKATRADPVMALSVVPGKTTRTRTRARTAPATSDPAVTRATGVDRGTCGDR